MGGGGGGGGGFRYEGSSHHELREQHLCGCWTDNEAVEAGSDVTTILEAIGPRKLLLLVGAMNVPQMRNALCMPKAHPEEADQ